VIIEQLVDARSGEPSIQPVHGEVWLVVVVVVVMVVVGMRVKKEFYPTVPSLYRLQMEMNMG
jgi:uncharacterized membrane protein YjdF